MKRLFYFSLTLFFTLSSFQLFSQDDFIRCYTAESDEALRQKYNLGTIQDFEDWLAPLVREQKMKSPSERAVVTLPVVFHVIHDNDAVGTGDNLATTYINAQLDQINNDFRKIAGTSGDNSNPVGADSEIEFCMAAVDPQGNPMAEPGINRIDRNTQGWSAPPYGQCRGPRLNLGYIENTIKPESQWDPNNYINIWVMDLNCGLLGYAQFPSNSGLPGLNADGGLASTDGVVVITGSVGSTDTPNPNPISTRFDAGRTLTHELGHFFGLRHIWGDATCGNDYCADTPTQQGSSSGCPNTTTCDGVRDMVENYMDYSDDDCMNVYTNDQKARMQAVMANSPRRASLASSTACSGTGNIAPIASFTFSATDLQVSFDGSGSSDSDGTITTYNWDFGDGSTATGVTTSHTYAAGGSYTVTLTVTDNEGAIGTDQQTVTVSTSTGATEMYVQSIVLSTGSAGGGNKTGVATVTIVDNNGSPVSNATVSGTFSGSLVESTSGTTNGSGVVVLETTSTKKGGKIDFGFCVDGVTHATLTYNSGLNVVTCTGQGFRIDNSRIIAEGDLTLRQYPNPVTDREAFFVFSLDQSSTVRLSLMNINGQLVQQQKTTLNEGNHRISMDLNVSSGMYFYIIKTDDAVQSGKLIIKNE